MTMKHLLHKSDECRGDPGNLPDYSGYIRLSPVALELATENPYRCPVSTPTINARNPLKVRNQPTPLDAYTGMNRSLQIPKHVSSPNHTKFRHLKTNKPIAKAQRKNFDYYFVRKIDKSSHIDVQTQSTWLSSLCSQPVDEIFGKYKRRSEGNTMTSQAPRSGNSTPGEKALISGWSSNVSNRGTSSVLSKSTKSGRVTTARNSRTSFVDPYIRVKGLESDLERIASHPGFGLMPVSPSNDEMDDSCISPSSSPLVHKVFRNNVNQFNQDPFYSSNTDIYSQYQRDKHFPDIKPRRSTFSPTRKRIMSESREPMAMTLSYPSRQQDLEESPIQIISIGKGSGNNLETSRLQKSLHMSLTELDLHQTV